MKSKKLIVFIYTEYNFVSGAPIEDMRFCIRSPSRASCFIVGSKHPQLYHDAVGSCDTLSCWIYSPFFHDTDTDISVEMYAQGSATYRKTAIFIPCG